MKIPKTGACKVTHVYYNPATRAGNKTYDIRRSDDFITQLALENNGVLTRIIVGDSLHLSTVNKLTRHKRRHK